MNWKNKALIMKVCAAIPGGGLIYSTLQKGKGAFFKGRVRANPMFRFPKSMEL